LHVRLQVCALFGFLRKENRCAILNSDFPWKVSPEVATAQRFSFRKLSPSWQTWTNLLMMGLTNAVIRGLVFMFICFTSLSLICLKILLTLTWQLGSDFGREVRPVLGGVTVDVIEQLLLGVEAMEIPESLQLFVRGFRVRW